MSNFRIIGGDATGLMYGGLQLTEFINLNPNLNEIINYHEDPVLKTRAMTFRPNMDLRTPSYTALADSSRWNAENTWDLSFWEETFANMARMRYNSIFDTSIV